jgi:hypothetical protein
MATPPFSAQFVTDLAGETAWKFEGRLGAVATVRGFCCDDPNDGVNPDGKSPVAHIDLDPNPAQVGETINYDGTLSYDPDGSVTGWAWTFESHTPSSGTAIAGTLNYGTVAGTFTIQLIVTDGTGVKSLPAREELVIEHPTFDAYVATETGVYYGSASDGTTTWTAKNTGLSGADLQANDVAIDPATQGLAEALKTVWRATDGGIQVSNDGGATWTEKNPASVSNQWSDATAPTVGGLAFTELLFADDKLFVGATWLNASSKYRSWVFYTTDYPAMRSDTSGTVTWTEITTNWDS